MAKIYKPDGQIIDIHPKNGTDFSLEEIQSIVNGYFETLSLPDGSWVAVNDKGKEMGLPININATKIIRSVGYDDCIVGNALICKYSEIR